MIEVGWLYSLNDKITAPLRAIEQSLGSADRAAQKLDNDLGGLEGSSVSLGSAFTSLASIAGGVLAGIGLYEVGNAIYDTGTKMETLNNVVKYTSGSVEEAAKNHEFLTEIIDKYRLPLVETTEGFSQFNAALMGSKLAGQSARDIYEGVSVAVTALHLPTQAASQVFMALNQMVSKGTVASQELKLQLGNALPGAFKLAANSMNMTTQEFTKMVEQGKVLSDDFLPKFAAKLKETYSGAIPAALESTNARATALHNEQIRLQVQLFESLQPFINAMLDLGIQVLPKIANALVGIMDAGKGVVQFFKDYADAIGWLVTVYAGYKAGLIITTGWQMLSAAWTARETLWTGALTTAKGILVGVTWALNEALFANPLGIIIGLLAGAVYVTVQLWNKFEGFRGVVKGTWEAMKVMAKGLFDLVMTPFISFGKLIAEVGDGLYNLFTGNFSELKKNAANIGNIFSEANPINKIKKLGSDAGAAYSAAYNAEVAPGMVGDNRNGVFKDVFQLQQDIIGGNLKPAKANPYAGATYNPNGATSASGSGSGGGNTRNITVTIQKLGEITIMASNVNDFKDRINEIRNMMHDEFIAMLRDSEVSYSNGG